MTFSSVTSSWVPLLSLTASVDPNGPWLLAACPVPLGDGVPAVSALGLDAVPAPCVCAGCGPGAEQAASARTAAVTATPVPSAPAASRPREEARYPITCLLRSGASPPAAGR